MEKSLEMSRFGRGAEAGAASEEVRRVEAKRREEREKCIVVVGLGRGGCGGKGYGLK